MTTQTSGLEGVTAAATRLSRVDGLAGELIIGGYALEEIAGRATYEEMLHLLWHDRLPTVAELETLSDALKAYRELPQTIMDALRAAAECKLDPMDALRIGAGMLSLSLDNPEDDMIAVVSAFPVLVATYWRLLNNETPVAPSKNLSHAANYLYMLTGETPDGSTVRAIDTYLNTVIDHGLNASTFTARVITSTGSDAISAVVGAVGALKGPLHGGAPGPALDMVFEIGAPENAESNIKARLERGERLMGFGHRVYKVRDPRAEVLQTASEQFFDADDDLYQLVLHVEQTAIRLLEEYKPGRNLQTNVEFYTALLLHGVGLPTTLFSPTFAVSRVGGWTAHIREHRETGRLIRPSSSYIGETGRIWIRRTFILQPTQQEAASE